MLTFPIREKDNRFRVDCEQDFRLCAKGFHTPHPNPLPVEGGGNLKPVAIIAVVSLFLRQGGGGDGSEDAEEGGEMIPAHFFTEIEKRENGKHGERDDLLNDFELKRRIDGVAPAVGGYLQQVFKKCDTPARENDNKQRRVLEFQ